MTRIDWFMMWKFHHERFFWTYLTVGLAIRVVLGRRFRTANWKNTSLFAVAAGSASAVFLTWLPIIPLIFGILLIYVAGNAFAQSLLIGVPLVAVSMAFETALIDAALIRMLLTEPVKGQASSLLIANILNALIALTITLAWAFHHPIDFIALAIS